MVGKIMRWLMRKAGLAYVTEEAFNAHNEAVTKMVLRNRETGFGLQESVRRLDDKVRLLEGCVQHLNEKLTELDGVCIVNGEDIEELRDEAAAQGEVISRLTASTQQPTSEQQMMKDMLTEWLHGYQHRPQEGDR